MTDTLLDIERGSTVIPTPNGDVVALDSVDLRVAPGEVIGIVGESGSGKSTLAKLIVGASAPGAETSGRIMLGEVDLTSLTGERSRRERGQRIGIVFQDPMMALNPVVPIGRQIAEAARLIGGLDRHSARKRAIELLEQVGVPDAETRLRHYPHQFSGGLRQRITIAMALICDPELLIADEATTALDVTVQRQILDLLAGLSAERGLAMIIVSHDLAVVAGRTHRTAVMYAGRIVEMGPTAELFEDPRHPYTRALLDAIPLIDRPPRSKLETIPGIPPDLTRLPEGCSFAPRCQRATPECLAARPETVTDGTRQYRCIHPVTKGAPS